MAYGGPNSLEEIPGYLADIRHGRTTGKRVLEEITQNYREIGGKSSLLDDATAQRDALAGSLGEGYRVYLGMRHWAPWIEDTVRTMIDDGITRIIGIVLAPHHSRVSIDAYHRRVREALRMYHADIPYVGVERYHLHEGLIAGLASMAKESTTDKGVHLVMSAHSIPKHFEVAGDTYQAQLRETASRVAKTLQLDDSKWSFSFQSKGRSAEEWLGPGLEEHLDELHARGISDVVVLPVGFLSDHVEVLFDVDMKAKNYAKSLGMTLTRARTLNTHPQLIRALSETIQDNVSTETP